VFDGDPGEGAAVLERATIDIDHASANLGMLVGDQIVDRRDVRQVEDVAGEHEQQVGDGVHRQPGEQFSPLGANSLDELDRLMEGRVVHGGGARRGRRKRRLGPTLEHRVLSTERDRSGEWLSARPLGGHPPKGIKKGVLNGPTFSTPCSIGPGSNSGPTPPNPG